MISKSIPLQIEAKADAPAGTISAYLTTFGNSDVVSDIMAKGSLDKFIAKFNPQAKKLPMFYEHDHTSIIGEWTGLKADEHGVVGEGVLYTETTKGSDVYKLMKRNAVSSVSIGFRSSDFEKNDDGGRTFKEIEACRDLLWSLTLLMTKHRSCPLNLMMATLKQQRLRNT